MSTQEILRDVPADRVDQIVADYRAIGAASVTKTQQADGRYTVTAVFTGSPHLQSAATVTAVEAAAPLPNAGDAPLPAINPSDAFQDIADEYRAYFDRCQSHAERRALVETQVGRLLNNAARYRAVGQELDIPWYFIGIAHTLEANMNFNGHLHNGDPLSARTVRVPAGRPPTGKPPFSWDDSARDAMVMKGFAGQSDWSIARMLHRWEAYNGFGYRARRLPTPYLWSFSPLYEKGRFVADHVFDPESVSQQCGAALLLKALQQRL